MATITRGSVLAIIFVAAALAAGQAAADEDERAAFIAGAADCATTAAAFALTQVVELNPIGPVAACTIEPLLVREINRLPEPERTERLHGLTATKWGAGANNVAVIAGLHGAAAPALGALVALAVWAAGAEEREFMEQCAIHERLAGHAMQCHYTPSKS